MKRKDSRRVWLIATLLGCSGAAIAQDPWLRCRSIAAAAERLACYDTIVDATTTNGGLPAVRQQSGPPLVSPLALNAAPSPPAAPAKSAASVAALPPESTYGLPKPSAGPVERNDIESSIPGSFEGWRPREAFTLANGQVWQIADDSEGAYSRRDPIVRIARGRFGGYFLYVEGIGQSPRVRRLK